MRHVQIRTLVKLVILMEISTHSLKMENVSVLLDGIWRTKPVKIAQLRLLDASFVMMPKHVHNVMLMENLNLMEKEVANVLKIIGTIQQHYHANCVKPVSLVAWNVHKMANVMFVHKKREFQALTKPYVFANLTLSKTHKNFAKTATLTDNVYNALLYNQTHAQNATPQRVEFKNQSMEYANVIEDTLKTLTVTIVLHALFLDVNNVTSLKHATSALLKSISNKLLKMVLVYVKLIIILLTIKQNVGHVIKAWQDVWLVITWNNVSNVIHHLISNWTKLLNYVNARLLSLNKTRNVKFVQNNLIFAKIVTKTNAKLAKMDSLLTMMKRNVSAPVTEISMRQPNLVNKKQDWVHLLLLPLLSVYWLLLEEVKFLLIFSCCLN